MEPSRCFIRHLEYLTLPAGLGPVPPALRGRAQWLVTCRPAGPRERGEAVTLERAGELIGYISLDYGIHPGSRCGRGRLVCVFGGFPGGPELDYLSHAGSAEQGAAADRRRAPGLPGIPAPAAAAWPAAVSGRRRSSVRCRRHGPGGRVPAAGCCQAGAPAVNLVLTVTRIVCLAAAATVFTGRPGPGTTPVLFIAWRARPGPRPEAIVTRSHQPGKREREQPSMEDATLREPVLTGQAAMNGSGRP